MICGPDTIDTPALFLFFFYFRSYLYHLCLQHIPYGRSLPLDL